MQRNELRLFLAVSLLLHAGVFLISYLQARRSVYVTLPIELFFYNAPGAVTPAPAVKEPAKTETLVKPDTKEEIALPKKKEKKRVEKKPEPAPIPETPAQNPPSALPSANQGGGQVSLDTANFPFAYYTNTIVKKIGRSWQWSNDFGRLKAVVFFRIRKDGSIAETAIKTPSGDSLFDQQALRAVKLSDPFPPLPSGYQEDTLGVFFEFSYR